MGWLMRAVTPNRQTLVQRGCESISNAIVTRKRPRGTAQAARGWHAYESCTANVVRKPAGLVQCGCWGSSA